MKVIGASTLLSNDALLHFPLKDLEGIVKDQLSIELVKELIKEVELEERPHHYGKVVTTEVVVMSRKEYQTINNAIKLLKGIEIR